MKLSKKLLLSVMLFALTFSSFAWWGPTGHRVVGEIAENHLTRKARKAVHEILGTESLGIATTWADFVRADTAFNYLASWHYINLKMGLNYDDFKAVLEKDSAVDAYTKLNFLVAELKNRSLEPDKKLMYLRLLIHIAGDIHQPMHVSRAEDQGGNKIRVMWFSDSTNLHSVWDEKLIEQQKLSYTEYAASLDHTTKEQRKEWQSQPMVQWFYDSYKIAGQLYSEITKPYQKLSFRYNFDHIATVNEQLLKGGVHLAGLLNEIFDQ